jgi:hypothetical protein
MLARCPLRRWQYGRSCDRLPPLSSSLLFTEFGRKENIKEGQHPPALQTRQSLQVSLLAIPVAADRNAVVPVDSGQFDC